MYFRLNKTMEVIKCTVKLKHYVYVQIWSYKVGDVPFI